MKNNEIQILGRLTCSSGKTHEKQEVFSGGGIIGAIPATTYKDPPKILIEVYNGKTKRYV